MFIVMFINLLCSHTRGSKLYRSWGLPAFFSQRKFFIFLSIEVQAFLLQPLPSPALRTLLFKPPPPSQRSVDAYITHISSEYIEP